QPSRSTMEADIAMLYNYCITFDIWTSRSIQSYISLIVHYISLQLGANPFPGHHGAEELASKLRELVDSWELSFEKLVAITCGNTSNNVKCCDEILKIFHLPCAGHVLNLAVHDGLRVRGISEVVFWYCKLTEHFNRSGPVRKMLPGVQKEKGLPEQQLIQDVQTRWNSIFQMICRLLKQKEAVIEAVHHTLPHPNSPLPAYMLSDVEWKQLDQLVPLLQLFYDTTAWISAASYVTASVLGPSLVMIHKALQMVNTNPQVIRCFKEVVLTKVDKYFTSSETETFLNKSCYLDPQFRAFIQKIESKRTTEEQIQMDLHQLIEKDADSQIATLDHVSNSTTSVSQTPTGLNRLMGTIFQPDSIACPDRTTYTTSEMCASEIAHYNALPLPNLDINPLEWWKVHSGKYMAKLAKKVLCVVGTSTPSESLFSTTGDIVTAPRDCSQAQTMERRKFLTLH
uniref:HAT C-terminal dimerisation domain-containing protein n=1 Tax=Latimeria chalumnae TaxID=7897 RepID=H3B6J7_LATCH